HHFAHSFIQRFRKSVRSGNRRMKRKKDANAKRSGEGFSESAAGRPLSGSTEPTQRHIKNAFRAGATVEEIMDVLKLGVVQGVPA
ncbi:MAG: hypothetical protein WAK48_29185, partial [Candidatus Acidiferrum sp.]